MRAITVLCVVALGLPARSEAQEAPACIAPPPSDEALVRSAAEWMLPARSIEIPEFEMGSPDTVGGTRARVTQAEAGLSLMPISRSVSHPRTDDFSISATMNLAATLSVEYSRAGVAGSCDLIVQGPLAVRADVMVDRSSQPTEDRVQPLTVNQVNDSGLRLQGCGEVAWTSGFASDVTGHLVALAVTEIFMPACRPCGNPAFQACTTP